MMNYQTLLPSDNWNVNFLRFIAFLLLLSQYEAIWAHLCQHYYIDPIFTIFVICIDYYDYVGQYNFDTFFELLLLGFAYFIIPSLGVFAALVVLWIFGFVLDLQFSYYQSILDTNTREFFAIKSDLFEMTSKYKLLAEAFKSNTSSTTTADFTMVSCTSFDIAPAIAATPTNGQCSSLNKAENTATTISSNATSSGSVTNNVTFTNETNLSDNNPVATPMDIDVDFSANDNLSGPPSCCFGNNNTIQNIPLVCVATTAAFTPSPRFGSLCGLCHRWHVSVTCFGYTSRQNKKVQSPIRCLSPRLARHYRNQKASKILEKDFGVVFVPAFVNSKCSTFTAETPIPFVSSLVQNNSSSLDTTAAAVGPRDSTATTTISLADVQGPTTITKSTSELVFEQPLSVPLVGNSFLGYMSRRPSSSNLDFEPPQAINSTPPTLSSSSLEHVALSTGSSPLGQATSITTSTSPLDHQKATIINNNFPLGYQNNIVSTSSPLGCQAVISPPFLENNATPIVTTTASPVLGDLTTTSSPLLSRAIITSSSRLNSPKAIFTSSPSLDQQVPVVSPLGKAIIASSTASCSSPLFGDSIINSQTPSSLLGRNSTTSTTPSMSRTIIPTFPSSSSSQSSFLANNGSFKDDPTIVTKGKSSTATTSIKASPLAQANIYDLGKKAPSTATTSSRPLVIPHNYSPLFSAPLEKSTMKVTSSNQEQSTKKSRTIVDNSNSVPPPKPISISLFNNNSGLKIEHVQNESEDSNAPKIDPTSPLYLLRNRGVQASSSVPSFFKGPLKTREPTLRLNTLQPLFVQGSSDDKNTTSDKKKKSTSSSSKQRLNKNGDNSSSKKH